MTDTSIRTEVPALLTPAPTRVMGVLNVTPDSFSDGGAHFDQQTAIAHGRALAASGAQLVDVGGESTRPGARRTEVAEDLVELVNAGFDLPNLRLALLDERLLVRKLMWGELRLEDLRLTLRRSWTRWALLWAARDAWVRETNNERALVTYCASSSTACLTPSTTVRCRSILTCWAR